MKFLTVKARSPRCVACGKPIEFSERGLPNHHCSRWFEAAVAAANRRAEADRFPMPTWVERLEFGFALLGIGTGN